jgi:hypothetical protein
MIPILPSAVPGQMYQQVFSLDVIMSPIPFWGDDVVVAKVVIRIKPPLRNMQ